MPKKGTQGNKGKSLRSPAKKRYDAAGRGNMMRGAIREARKVRRRIARGKGGIGARSHAARLEAWINNR